MTEQALSPTQKLVELARPVVLTLLFVFVGLRWSGVVAAPIALAAVFAWSLLVHDLIHNALRLPPRMGSFALAFSAQFLLKSGHALRAMHTIHHKRCLEEADHEGKVAFDSFPRLAVFGPWLALRARADAWNAAPATRSWQRIESLANVVLLFSLFALAALTRSPLPLIYWGAIVVVTITAPIWGAKIPHMVPYAHPIVRWLASFTNRFTPAVASVLLHELHHRHPGLPVALLPAHQHELDTTAPSNCAEKMQEHHGIASPTPAPSIPVSE